METQTASSAGKGKRPRRSKAKSAAEKVIKLESLQNSIADLITLYMVAVGAKDSFAEAIEAAAERCGLSESVVRKFVQARAGDKFEEKKREANQLSLCFDEIGEA